MNLILIGLLAVAGIACAQTTNVSNPSLSSIEETKQLTPPKTTTSDVKGGVAFDRFYQIWLENIVR